MVLNTSLLRSRKGASLTDYGILTGLISLLAIGAVLGTGTEIRNIFSDADDTLGEYVAGNGDGPDGGAGVPETPVRPADPYGFLNEGTFLIGTPAADVLDLGTGSYEGVYGREGADTITGTNAGEIFAGEQGDDIIDGGKGGDTYAYVLGDGSDHIHDYDPSLAESNKDRFYAPDIALADITLNRSSRHGDLYLDMPDGARITIENFLKDNRYEKIDYFDLAEGTIGEADIRAELLRQEKPRGLVQGTAYASVYTHDSAVDGSYTVYDQTNIFTELDQFTFVQENVEDVQFINVDTPSNNSMKAVTSDGDEITFELMHDTGSDYQIETWIFADGTTLTEEEVRTKSLEDSKSTGYVDGTEFADQYYYSKGDGSYTIEDFSYHISYIDRLTFLDATASEVTIINDGTDYTVTIGSDVITLPYQDVSNRYRVIEEFEFLDQTLDAEGVRDKAANDAKATGYVNLPHYGATITHVLADDGSYIVDPFTDLGGSSYYDTIEFPGVNSTDITVTSSGNDAIITIIDPVNGNDVITIDDQFQGSNRRQVDVFVFDDTTWYASDLSTAAGL